MECFLHCDDHGVFYSLSSLGTSWTRWARVSIPDGHLLLSWRTPITDCSRRLHCLGSHIVPEWIKPVLSLWWRFWGPARGLLARLCQMPSWSLWTCGTDGAVVSGASLWWLLKIYSTALRPDPKPTFSSFQQFLSHGLESVEDKLEHDLAGIADGTFILIRSGGRQSKLQVVFLGTFLF